MEKERIAMSCRERERLKVLHEIESLCEVYLKALAVGEPALLSRAQMAEVIEKFRSYGQAASVT